MTNCRRMVTALALVLLAPAASVFAQEESAPMLASDHEIVTAQSGEITESAKIYGYDLAAGNWTSTQAHCAALADVILLQYRQIFPDGAQSRFTAVVPRTAGRVRIVPVLYHGATPFVPAASNPRNYALFNQLVKEAGGAPSRLELSGCYAELTGGDSGPLPQKKPAIATAPGPTLHLDPESKASSVTLASRATPERYQVWSVSFDQKGSVTKATTKAHSVSTAAENQAASPALEPGWKYVPRPPDPPSKFIPPAPQPPTKILQH